MYDHCICHRVFHLFQFAGWSDSAFLFTCFLGQFQDGINGPWPGHTFDPHLIRGQTLFDPDIFWPKIENSGIFRGNFPNPEVADPTWPGPGHHCRMECLCNSFHMILVLHAFWVSFCISRLTFLSWSQVLNDSLFEDFVVMQAIDSKKILTTLFQNDPTKASEMCVKVVNKVFVLLD